MTLNGDLVPHSIFVGNLPLTVIQKFNKFKTQFFKLLKNKKVTDTELLDYFSKLTNSHLKEAKIITDQKGLSKG